MIEGSKRLKDRNFTKDPRIKRSKDGKYQGIKKIKSFKRNWKIRDVFLAVNDWKLFSVLFYIVICTESVFEKFSCMTKFTFRGSSSEQTRACKHVCTIRMRAYLDLHNLRNPTMRANLKYCTKFVSITSLCKLFGLGMRLFWCVFGYFCR